jgi:hypothetical protein
VDARDGNRTQTRTDGKEAWPHHKQRLMRRHHGLVRPWKNIKKLQTQEKLNKRGTGRGKRRP